MLRKEQEEMERPLEERIKEWLIDFLNLVFGNSQDTQDFWDEVIYAEVSAYYNFEYKELKNHKRNLNALYFALVEQLGLEVTRVSRNAENQD